jgi:hypothetical protein
VARVREALKVLDDKAVDDVASHEVSTLASACQLTGTHPSEVPGRRREVPPEDVVELNWR